MRRRSWRWWRVASLLPSVGRFELLLLDESTENSAVAGVVALEMQETPTDPEHVRAYVQAMIDAGVLDDDPPDEAVARPADGGQSAS